MLRTDGIAVIAVLFALLAMATYAHPALDGVDAVHRVLIPRKEVIQPHLPIRLPCYDLVPLTSLTFGASLLAVGTTTSGATNSGGLTGGVYKAQEHIHRGVADPRLLANPASCRRIAACNPNWGRLYGIGSASRLGNPLYRPL